MGTRFPPGLHPAGRRAERPGLFLAQREPAQQRGHHHRCGREPADRQLQPAAAVIPPKARSGVDMNGALERAPGPASLLAFSALSAPQAPHATTRPGVPPADPRGGPAPTAPDAPLSRRTPRAPASDPWSGRRRPAAAGRWRPPDRPTPLPAGNTGARNSAPGAGAPGPDSAAVPSSARPGDARRDAVAVRRAALPAAPPAIQHSADGAG